MTALATTSTFLPAASKPLPLTFVQELFKFLEEQFGKKVYDLFGDSEPAALQQTWASGLAGLRRRELQRGAEAIRARRFVPVMGEFVLLCRPALDPEYAWYEAQDGLRARDRGEPGMWSHPAVYRAAIAMGGLGVNVRKGSFTQARRRWEIALGREFAAGWGDEVPDPAPRIANEPTVKDIPADVKRQLSNLSKSFSRKEP